MDLKQNHGFCRSLKRTFLLLSPALDAFLCALFSHAREQRRFWERGLSVASQLDGEALKRQVLRYRRSAAMGAPRAHWVGFCVGFFAVLHVQLGVKVCGNTRGCASRGCASNL